MKSDAQQSSPLVGRFAPSPTGRIHAGNIVSALIGWLFVKQSNGLIILRIEDLDRSRSRDEYATQLMRDYEALGLTWDQGPYFQSERFELYKTNFEKLYQLKY